MSIGARISEERQKANLSQYQLAKILDVSRQAVSKWENDLTSPDTLNLIRLADVLNTDIEYLATGRTVCRDPAPVVVKLINKEPVVQVKTVEKPVVKRIIVRKYIRNPFEYVVLSGLSVLIGFIIGKIL